MEYFLFGIAALLPVLVAIGVFLLDKHTRFSKLNYWAKQCLIGFVFGFLAILSTHFGIPFSGAQANVRDGAVVIAGLVFGWPAGIIAGLFAGIERFVACYFPAIQTSIPYLSIRVGNYTQIACSISTIIAGVLSALLRKFMFDDKKPGWAIGLFTAFVIEVFHLLMVFVTNASTYAQAIAVVKACTPPMLIGNSFSVMFAILAISILEKGKEAFKKPDVKSLTGKFTAALTILTLASFILSSTFVYFFQQTMSTKQTDKLLENALRDVTQDVNDRIDNVLLSECEEIKEEYGQNLNNPSYTTIQDMQSLADEWQLYEINIVNSEGIIVYSNIEKNLNDNSGNPINFNDPKYDNEYVSEFRQLLNSQIDEIIQPFRLSNTDNDNNNLKYAGIRTDFGFIQVGFEQNKINGIIGDQMTDVTKNQHIEQFGIIVVIYGEEIKSLSTYDNTVKDSDKINFKNSDTELINTVNNAKFKKTYTIQIEGKDCYFRVTESLGYKIVSVISKEEARISRDISIYINTFLEIIVFGMLFLLIYILIGKVIITRVKKTNNSLNKITQGNLEEIVEGGTTTEFISLAKGINLTVDALKGYIDAANKRIDDELAFAKAIQTSSLPSVFPAFPDRKEFDIHATMKTAKEVGGDFYDFYFSNTNTFHFTVADVSGKGIPAALFMMRAKQALKSLTQTNMPINEVFEKGNANLCEGNEAGMFVTAWEASVNLETGNLSFANGGHNPPLIKHANGKFEYLTSRANMVLAAMDGMKYNYNEFSLDVGDIVYLYTDGVTEAVNEKGEQYGEARLKEALNAKEFKSCKEICEFIAENHKNFTGEADQFDDITMVCFKYNGK